MGNQFGITGAARNGLGTRLRFYRLTPREEEIVWLVLRGYANKEIATRCFITEQTVKDHLKHVYQKMGIHQRASLFTRLLGMELDSEPGLAATGTDG